MTSDTNGQPDFQIADDTEAMAAVVLAAVVGGDLDCRAQLPALQTVFEEPYRTVAAVVHEKLLGDEFLDRYTLASALVGQRLTRRNDQGQVEELSAEEVVNLILATDLQPGQPAAYLQVLQEKLQARRRDELKERAIELAKQFGDQPQKLAEEVEQLATQVQRAGGPAFDQHPTELLQLIPYIKRLEQRQRGADFLGLDSGFAHFNNLCNGLDTGLSVVAAPPGFGKTTLIWQMCCQAAQINKLPVVFFSLEQSADELRAKALARISKLQYRHILRGRLRSDDPENWPKVLEAAKEYFGYGQHLTIIEGDHTTTIDVIGQVAAAKMARAGAARCLVVVDYLQILPLDPNDAGRVTSVKDRVDLQVSALRRIARKLNSPVIAVSSMNRTGYNSKHLDVFKESGGIEYSADIAAVLTRDKHSSSEASNYRNLHLNIIKHRNGERGVITFKFYAQRAEFIETAKNNLPEDQTD